MTSRHDKPGMQPTPNAPNPAKFLKEMETLVPLLKRKGIIPMSREEARAMGERGTKAAALRAELEHRRRCDIIGRRLDEYMQALSPWAFRLALAFNLTWLFRALGYSYDIQATREALGGAEPVDCTQIRVYRRWFPFFFLKTVKAERLVWEEPKPPKSRIIKP